MRYRIALCGFSAFEYRAMRFSFQSPVAGASHGYEVVDALVDADFAVVDADARPAVKGVLQSGYLARSVFVGGVAPAGALVHLLRPIDTTRILRTLDELVAATAPRPGAREPSGRSVARALDRPLAAPSGRSVLPMLAPAPSGPGRRELPTLNDVVGDPFDFLDTVGDPPDAEEAAASWAARPEAALYGEAFGEAAAPPPTRPTPRVAGPRRRAFDASNPTAPASVSGPSALPPDPDEAATAQHAAKAAARAKARRARFAGAGSAAVEPLRDALVIGPDAEANIGLCTLLERFGFEPVALSTLLQAHQLVAERRPALAAVFMDLPLDDAGLALLQRIRALPAAAGHASTAVHLVASSVGPADRVRVALAGLPEPLIKPLSRGDVARALERSGIPFPADARRH